VRSEDRDLLKKFLPAVPFFSRLSLHFMDQVLKDFTFHRFSSGEVIFRQGDSSSDLYVILGGRVRVTLMSDEGEELVLAEQGEGDFFGEISLIDGEPRSATVVAEKDCTFGVLGRERLLGLIMDEPMVAVELLKSLTFRFRGATAREHRLAFLGVRERLCRFFTQKVMEEGVKEGNGRFRISKMTHRDLAMRIGASRESVTKALKALGSEELVLQEGGSLLVSPAISGDYPED